MYVFSCLGNGLSGSRLSAQTTADAWSLQESAAPSLQQPAFPQPTYPLPSVLPSPLPAPFEMPPLVPPGGGLPAREAELTPDSTAAPIPEILDEPSWGSGEWWLPSDWQEWLLAKYWSGGLEIGVNATEGNAEAFSSRVGAKLKRKSDRWDLSSDLTYAKATVNGVESQHNAIFNSGYERLFGISPWSHFGKLNLEYDEFKAFDLRLAMNAGLGYQLLKNDLSQVKARFGTGVSHEINSPDSRWVPEAVFGADLAHQISQRQKLGLTVDYFPEWTDFINYRLVTDAHWTVALDDASKLSLKLSVNNRYDSTPNGRRPNDVIYALLLLWQM